MKFWDWKTGHNFQSLNSIAQPGSLDAEAGLMSTTFDQTGLRLICGEADKTSECFRFAILHLKPNLFAFASSQNMEAGRKRDGGKPSARLEAYAGQEEVLRLDQTPGFYYCFLLRPVRYFPLNDTPTNGPT